jgi:hypothetical protein
MISDSGSRGNSPALRPQSGSLGPLTEDFLLGGTRDESAYYQAETQMLTRENQMLKARIRELGKEASMTCGKTKSKLTPFQERQINDLGGTSPGLQQSPLTSVDGLATKTEAAVS